jgi:hypothetical protein
MSAFGGTYSSRVPADRNRHLLRSNHEPLPGRAGSMVVARATLQPRPSRRAGSAGSGALHEGTAIITVRPA